MNPIEEGILSQGLTYEDYRARVTRSAEIFDEVYGRQGFSPHAPS